MASPDYQVGAHFEALGEGVLMAPSKSIGYFFAISSCPEVRCAQMVIILARTAIILAQMAIIFTPTQ